MANKNIEYEIKAWAPPAAKLNELLKNFNNKPVEKTQEDVYFDTQDKKLFKKGIFTRIRNNKITPVRKFFQIV